MLFGHETYREFLREVLTRRQGQNKSYSMRAMARQLGLAPSMLSDLLKGQRHLSSVKGAEVARRLGLGAEESEYFLLMIQREGEKAVELQALLEDRLRALNPGRQVRSLNVEIFKLISDWYHIPVLEMTGLSGFEISAPNVARRLGISIAQAEHSLALLEKLQLIEQAQDGGWEKTHLNVLAASPVVDQGLRQFHKQMLEKAIQSVDAQTPEEKYIGSETFCFDDEQLGELKRLADDFFDKAVALAQKSNNKQHVRHLGVQFFKLTKATKEEIL